MNTNKLDDIRNGLFAIEFDTKHQVQFEVENDTLLLTFQQFGDLPVVVAVSESQILVESVLVERDEFEDPSEIDLMLLKAHKYFPLSTIGVEFISGKYFYVIFGALSIKSTPSIIAEELLTLAKNTMDVIDALEPFYKFNKPIEKKSSINQGELNNECA